MNVPRLIGIGLYVLVFLALADLVGITDVRWPWEAEQSEPKLELDKLAPEIRQLEKHRSELEKKLRELESTVFEVEKMELRRQIEELARKLRPYLDSEGN
jgi:DNA-binding transcriptional MerR regulator